MYPRYTYKLVEFMVRVKSFFYFLIAPLFVFFDQLTLCILWYR